MQYLFEKKLRSGVRKDNAYNRYNIALRVDGEYFNPHIVSDTAKRIQSDIRGNYWNFFNKILDNRLSLLVKLGGLHFNLFDIEKYLFFNDKGIDMILHYHNWPIDQSGVYEKDSFALIKCDKRLFKTLFKEFWFALGFELRFEGLLINSDKVAEMESWIKRKDNPKKHTDLLEMSEIVFDNLENGFHFCITTKGKYIDRIPFHELGLVYDKM